MIETALCDWFRYLQLEDGAHRRDDEYCLALYRADADLGRHTRGYTAKGEVEGDGYEAGGKVLTGRRVQVIRGVAVLDWAAPVWDPATITAGGCLIYNNSLDACPAVLTVRFPEAITSTNGPFQPLMPPPGPETSLVQWGIARDGTGPIGMLTSPES